MLKDIYYNVVDVKPFEFGALIFTERSYDKQKEIFVCFYDEECLEMGKPINKNKVCEIFETFDVKDNVRFVYEGELSEDVEKWLKSKGVKIQEIMDFVAEYCIEISKINDEIVKRNPEIFEDIIQKVFRK